MVGISFNPLVSGQVPQVSHPFRLRAEHTEFQSPRVGASSSPRLVNAPCKEQREFQSPRVGASSSPCRSSRLGYWFEFQSPRVGASSSPAAKVINATLV